MTKYCLLVLRHFVFRSFVSVFFVVVCFTRYESKHLLRKYWLRFNSTHTLLLGFGEQSLGPLKDSNTCFVGVFSLLQLLSSHKGNYP